MRTYGRLKLHDGRWWFLEIEPHVVIRLKHVFQKIPKTAVAPHIAIDDTPENARELEWFMSRYAFRISDSDLLYLTGERGKHLQKMEELEAIVRPDYVPVKFDLKLEPRIYQKTGTSLYLANKRLLIGDVVGLGKTAQAIASFCEPKTLPALVVVQTHLPKQWLEETRKFTTLSVHIIKGTKPYSLPPADVYITKYSCLAGWVDIYNTGFFRSVVFDEIQELRRTGTLKYDAAKIVTEKADYVLGLSATPIYNFGDEIYNVLDLINPGCLGNWGDFAREWCSFENRIKDPKALGTYLRENFLFLRRTRKDVGRELPPINKIIYKVDYDEEKVATMEERARMLAIRTTTGSFIERGQAARDLDIMMRMYTGVAKAKGVAEYVKVLLESGEPVLLAGWHRDVYDIWLKELKDYNPVMYTGSESPTQKEKSKQDFISGESNLMIISLRSGIGLNGLQERCSLVVFGELDWSPKVHDQVIGRVDRDRDEGEQQVTAIFLVTDSGSDPPMIDLLGLKSSESQAIVDPDNALEVVHADESRIRKLAEYVLRKAPPVKEEQQTP